MDISKMTKTPWKIDPIHYEIHIVHGDGSVAIASLYSDPMDEETTHNALAIVSAVNSTWGANINPEAVPNLINTLQSIAEELLKTAPSLCDTQNPQHMAMYNCIHSAKAAINKAKIV